MSYSISEAIDDNEDRNAVLRTIRQRFPKADLRSVADGQQVWQAHGVLEVANDLAFHTDKNGNVDIYPIWTDGRARVYPASFWPKSWRVWLDLLRKTDAYRAMIEATVDRT